MENNLIKNFSVSGKEDSLNKMLSILKFIAKIREGEKIDVKSMSVVHSDIPSRAYRTFVSRESRLETLEFIKISINRAIDMIYYYLSLKEETEHFNKDVAKIIICNLNLCKQGLKNLTVTYEEDRKFTTDIETLIETMDIKIQGKNKLFDGINELENY